MVKPTRLELRTGTKFLRGGHPWVYRDADVRALGPQRSGTVIDVFDAGDKRFVGRGLYDAESDIAVRLFTWDEREYLDLDLVRRRLRRAAQGRSRVIDASTTSAFRLVNGEGDELPGLVVDVYDGFAIVQPYAAAWLPWLDAITSFLVDELGMRGASVTQRIRNVRGEAQRSGGGSNTAGRPLPARLTALEHGLRFEVRPESGQKGGLFLDQRDNRRAVAAWCAERRVLNLFAYTGGFSIHALAAGAAHVTSLDVAPGLATSIDENLALNGLDPARHEFIAADAFAWLDKPQRPRFDVVVVDPPSLATSRKQVPQAEQAYVKTFAAAASAVVDDGLLVACSCTAQVGEEAFLTLVARAMDAAQRAFRIVEVRGLPPDHPTLAALPESRYLKCALIRIDPR